MRMRGSDSYRSFSDGRVCMRSVGLLQVFEFDSTDSFGGKPKRDLWGSTK